MGAVNSATGGTYLGAAEASYTLSGFVQYDWHVSHTLTVNIGLRYDYQQPPYERDCGSSNFNPTAINPQTHLPGEMQYACKDYGNTFLKPEYTDFAPRFGFAWDPTGAGKFMVRGGYAIFFPSTFNVDYFGTLSGFASTITTYSAPGGNTNQPAFYLRQGFPTPLIQPLGSALGPSLLLNSAVTYDQPDQRTPMSQQWSFSLQKQIRDSWVIDISYSGNRGTHLVAGGYAMNQLNPIYDDTLKTALENTVSNPYYGMVPGASATITLQQSLLPFPYYTTVSTHYPHLGSSIYHSALLRVQKRLRNGLTFLASYSKAKLIDDSEASPIDFGSIEQVLNDTYQNSYDRRQERSVDPTDIAQRLAISSVYQLPFGAGRHFDAHNRLANAIVGGWQAQTIITLQTGNPVLITGANNNLATRPNSTGQSAWLSNPTQYEWFNTAAFVNPPSYTFGNVGRALPDVRNPGFFNYDLSVSKNTTIRERLKAQFRVEAFNLDNHVNLGYPNTAFVAGANGLNSSSTFGTITSARAPRVIQLGLKLSF